MELHVHLNGYFPELLEIPILSTWILLTTSSTTICYKRRHFLQYQLPTISKGYSRWAALIVVYMLKRKRKLTTQNIFIKQREKELNRKINE